MSTLTQDHRFLAITTPLGKDVLILTGFNGSEAISELFQFDLELISENHQIPFDAIVGEDVSLRITRADGSDRFISGMVCDFSQGRGGGGPEGPVTGAGDVRYTHYTARVVPRLWLLTRTAGSRIFQEKSATDIIEQIFADNQFSDYTLRLSRSYDTRTYCVQYRETDFAFVSRLMEEEGIHYFFEHDDGRHLLVLADNPAENKPCPGQESARYQISGEGWLEEDTISGLSVRQEIRSNKYTLNDFNFEVPSANLLVDATAREDIGPGEREIYDHPGRFGNRGRGDHLSTVRIEQEEGRIWTLSGTSFCRSFSAGYRFRLVDFYREDLNDKEYLIVSVSHEVRPASEMPGLSADSGDLVYRNRFRCIPYEIAFRPPAKTPKPFVHGAQTAIVTGPAGEEIHTDQFGRIKVQFHWDREGQRNEKSSCWIRVSQVWAGSGWGAMHIPRIGQEVIVDFVEGDPDCPIVTGRVYHGTNLPPYSLPAEKTKSTIKSNSSLGGGGFNEIRFEDKTGEEEIFIHAQKDENTVVENDQTIAVGHDRAESIGRDRSLVVGRDKSEEIGRNKKILVQGFHDEKIMGSQTILVNGSLGETVTVNYSEVVGAAMQLTVGGALAISAGGALAETIGVTKLENIGTSKSENIGTSKSLKTGKDYSQNIARNKDINIGADLTEQIKGKHKETAEKEYILQAKKVQVMAEDQIHLKTGKAEIILKKNGDITIKGKKINVKGSGDVVIKGSKIKEN